MKKFNLYILGLLLLFVASSCENEDFTDQASLEPAAGVNVSIDASNIANSYMESNQDTIRVTLELSELQSGADVVVFANKIGGNAVLGEDLVFIDEDGFGLAKKVIPATSDATTATWSIVVLEDDVNEGSESAEFQFGDDRTANATVEPVTASFDILNYTADDLALDLTWSTEATDTDGTELAGDDAADLKLLLKDSDGNVVETFDDAGFKSVVIAGDYADGEYTLAAEFASAIDLGAQGFIDLSIALDAFQEGGASYSYTFENALNTGTNEYCQSTDFNLAVLTKSGTSYEMSRVGEMEQGPDISGFTGAYICNEPGYGDYEVNFQSISVCPGFLEIDNFWDFGISIFYVLNTDGTVEIPAQSASAGGTPVIIEGAGTYDDSDNSMVVNYTVADPASGGLYDANTHTFTKQ